MHCGVLSATHTINKPLKQEVTRPRQATKSCRDTKVRSEMLLAALYQLICEDPGTSTLAD